MAEGGNGSGPPSQAVSPASGAIGASVDDPHVGRLINGRFKIVSLLARGGMGRVYRAEQAPLGRVCAVKILTTTYEGEHDPEFHKRFFLEASIASKITHPNSVTIFDYGQTDDDVYFMAMEYLEGVTLHRAIRVSGAFPEARVAHIGRQVCRALREAHALGCIHRDLKPANIFLTEHGDEPDFVKVLDFGLVKNVVAETKPEDQLTQTGLFMGSPKYMAPEQIRGERVDARTDVYALGIILYEMLTGKVPFDRTTSLNTLMAQVNDAPPKMRDIKPDVDASPELEDLVVRCMAKDPRDRVGSMDEVLAALKRVGGLGGGLTGEYRALGASASGPFSRADPTPSASGPPKSQPPSVVPSAPGGDQPSVSVTLSAPHTIPSVTPMVESAGGGSITVRGGSIPPPNFRRRSGPNVPLIVGGLALAGGLLALVLARRPEPPPASASAAPPPPSAAAPMPAATSPSPSSVTNTLSVHFASEPPGASVKENGEELCAPTPCDHAFAADTTVDHKVVISRQGFRPETRVVHATDAQIAVTLAPVRAWTPPARGASPKAADSPASTPQGFKDIPY